MIARKFEVVIVGGSYAGLAAAMALGRSLRAVLVIDRDTPCNRFTPESHNFITHDGRAPQEIAALAKAQVLAYPSVHFLNDEVIALEGVDGNFVVNCAAGGSFQTQKILFASGVEDLLATIPGLAECWGKTVLHCPYCHGYEVRGERTGIWINDPLAAHFVRLIKNWTTDITLFTHGPAQFDLADLDALGVAVVQNEIIELVQENGQLAAILCKEGIVWEGKAIYHRAPFRQQSPLPESLGCQMSEMGHIAVDGQQMTTVPGIYAAGDCTTPFRSVSAAVSGGNLAGAMINHAFIFAVV